MEEGEEEEVGGVGQGFRWRRWRGLERELRREMELLGEKAAGDQDGEDDDEEVGLDAEDRKQGAEGVGGEEGAKKKGEGVSTYSVSHML